MRTPSVVSGIAVLALSASAFAQPPGPFGPGFGGAGRPDVKAAIGATDEEWKVINPKLQKVIAARQVLASDLRGPDAGFGFGMPGFGPSFGGSFSGPGFGPPGGGFPGGPPGFGPPSAPPAQLLPVPLQDQLKLTADQKQQVEMLQKEFEEKLGKVLTEDQKKQLAQLRQGGAATPPGNPNAGRPAAPAPTDAVGQARADLKALLAEPKHAAADVEAKVAAVRKARQKARADLEAAEKDLEQVLTAEQQAVLVSLGYLD